MECDAAGDNRLSTDRPVELRELRVTGQVGRGHPPTVEVVPRLPRQLDSDTLRRASAQELEQWASDEYLLVADVTKIRPPAVLVAFHAALIAVVLAEAQFLDKAAQVAPSARDVNLDAAAAQQGTALMAASA